MLKEKKKDVMEGTVTTRKAGISDRQIRSEMNEIDRDRGSGRVGGGGRQTWSCWKWR